MDVKKLSEEVDPNAMFNKTEPVVQVLDKLITEKLRDYDQKKGLYRRILGDNQCIKRVLRLSRDDRNNLFKVYQCFAIEPPKKEDASYEFYQAILNQFTPALREIHRAQLSTQKNFDLVMKLGNPDLSAILHAFNEFQLLTQKNFDILIKHLDLLSLKKILDAISNKRSIDLDQSDFDGLIKHSDLVGLARVLDILSISYISLEKNDYRGRNSFARIIQHTDFVDLIKILETLYHSKFLTKENFKAVIFGCTKSFFSDDFVCHSDSADIAVILDKLNKAGLLTQANFDTIIGYPTAELVKTLIVFDDTQLAQLLTQESFDTLIKHFKLGKLIEILTINIRNDAKLAQLLTPENFTTLIKYSDLPSLLKVLCVLTDSQCLTQENLGATLQHRNLDSVIPVLDVLSNTRTRLLLQHNVELLLSLESDNVLLTTCVVIWSQIPPDLLTQAVFNEFIELARGPNPVQQVQYFRDVLLGIHLNEEEDDDDDEDDTNEINDAQSTHRTSVHQSISECVKKLFGIYRGELEGAGLEKIIRSIADYISTLPYGKNRVTNGKISIDKNRVAKACFARITAPNYRFTDPLSQCTIKEVLALTFLTIHDPVRRIGSLEDALAQFVEGLYEIQRGYNLSKTNVDRGKSDKPICSAGTFNKLIEKLQGIHPDAEILYITQETAALKLPIVVSEVAMDYLSTLSNHPQAIEGSLSFIQLIEQIKADKCVDVIWNQISVRVEDRLFEEFGSLYREKIDPNFINFVESGRYKELDDVSRFQEKTLVFLADLQGCNQVFQYSAGFFSAQKAAANYLREHRHDSPEAQQKYDEKFGLVLKK